MCSDNFRFWDFFLDQPKFSFFSFWLKGRKESSKTSTTPMTTFTKTTKTKQEPIFKAASMKKSPTGPGSKMNQFVWRVNCLHLFQTSWLQSKSSRAISRLSQIKSLKWPFRPYLEHRELWTNSPALKLTNGFRLRPLCEGFSEKILNIPSKNCQRLIIFYQKWQNFAKSGHTN